MTRTHLLHFPRRFGMMNEERRSVMNQIRLLAFDLDGTLLNSNKELTPRTREALSAAAEAGVELVPTTGRFFTGMPQAVRELPFVHYAITINGAQVYDIRKDCAVSRAEIPLETALAVMEFLDGFPVIYDCYQDNFGRMTRHMQQAAADFVPNPHALRMVRELRQPVGELKAYLRAQGRAVQKVQFFTPDDTLRLRLHDALQARFDTLAITSSMPCNVEINDVHANKGEAIASLCAYLGLPLSAAMAIGDGLNDRSMIKMAGLGVAMANAEPEILALADAATASCDEDGTAKAIERFCLGKEG